MMWSCHLCQLDRQNACCWKFQARFQKNFGLLWQKFNVPDASLLDWNKLWQGNLQKQPLFCVFVPFTMYSICIYVSLWDWQPLHLRLWSYDFENTLHAKKEKSCLSSQRPFLLRSFLFPLSILFIDFPRWVFPSQKVATSIYTHYLCIFHFLGRKIAIDASMSIYQFLIAVRSDGSQLTNEAGEITRLKHQYKLNLKSAKSLGCCLSYNNYGYDLIPFQN